MRQELERLKEKLESLEPGTEQYNKVLAEYKEIYRIVRQTEIDEDKRINDAHHRELEEKKFQHDQVKFENQLDRIDYERLTEKEKKNIAIIYVYDLDEHRNKLIKNGGEILNSIIEQI